MNYSILLTSPLLKGLNEKEVEYLLKKVPHRIKKYPAGSLIAVTGEQVNALMVVISGMVKGEMIDYSGRVIKIEDIPACGALAAGFIFGEKDRFPVNVISSTETELLIIDKFDFLKLLQNNDRILINFLNLVSNRSQFLSEKVRFMTFKTIKSKLANYILQIAGKTNSLIIIDKTQNELAELFGVARPSLARALGELKNDGYLDIERKRIRILDKKGFAKLTKD